MSQPTFEETVRAALVSVAPADMPERLERRARSIAFTPPPTLRSRLATGAGRRGIVALVAATATIVVVSAVVVLRPGSPPDLGSGKASPVDFHSAFGSLTARDFELVIGDRSFGAPLSNAGGRASTASPTVFAGTSTFGSLELHWIERAAPMTLVVYFAADARSWWVSEIVASEGRSDGAGWLYFEGPFFERPVGTAFDANATIVSSRSTDGADATLRFGRLHLTAFESNAPTRDPSKGAMPPTPPVGGSVDDSGAPDFIAVAAPTGGIAGYVSRAMLDAPGPVNGFVGQAPDLPVYADDLRTLVGYSVAGRGFVPLGSEPGTVATLPVRVAPSGSASAPSSSSASAALMPGELMLATSPPSNIGAGDSRLDGILRGKVLDGHACFWVEPPTATTIRMALAWPFGYHAYADPLSIHAPDYRVIALVGDSITLGGGGPPVDYQPTPEQDPCGFGAIFVVSGVLSVNGTPSNGGG